MGKYQVSVSFYFVFYFFKMGIFCGLFSGKYDRGGSESLRISFLEAVYAFSL